MCLTAARDMPIVNFFLYICALRQKYSVFWPQLMCHFRQTIPKLAGTDGQSDQSFRLDEFM